MKKTVTLTFNSIPEGMTDDAIRFAVQDAICEFWANRDPVELYVQKRYGTHPESFRAAKMPWVARRVALMKENVSIGDIETVVDACPFCGCTEPYEARAEGLWPSCVQCNGV